MKRLLWFSVVFSSVLVGCAAEMAQSGLREQCAKAGKQVFFTSTSQNGIPLFLESASAMGVCLDPENVSHLPASFGADIVRIRITGQEGIGLFSVVPGSAAYKAGLEASDFIYEFRGRPVAHPDELQSAIEAARQGEQTTVKYRRNGSEKATTVQF